MTLPNEADDPLPIVDLKDLVVEIIHVSREDQRALADAILNPPPPAPALLRAVERYRRLIKQG